VNLTVCVRAFAPWDFVNRAEKMTAQQVDPIAAARGTILSPARGEIVIKNLNLFPETIIRHLTVCDWRVNYLVEINNYKGRRPTIAQLFWPRTRSFDNSIVELARKSSTGPLPIKLGGPSLCVSLAR